ncbi:MAG: SDR family oxidoreductase [Bacilli bacterium]|nr:SDR family oxidoreductase [Bacilli bacterium]
MLAIITGASSGIGYDMAKILSKRGYDLILVARRKERLLKLKQTLKTEVTVISLDLSITENCYSLYERVRNQPIDIVINNAGFGLFGEFSKQSLEKELNMVDLNIKAVHILTKLFLQDFMMKDNGYILNVASSAAFQPGPLMATYYATKAYVLRLTEGIYEELRRKKSHVYIGCLCPGPVATEFNQVANVSFSLNGLSSNDVAQYAIEKMLQRKLIIIPGILMKLNVFFNRFVPRKLLLRIVYHIQRQKDGV